MNKDIRTLPPIPDKLYFTIGETSELCNVKPHVLRYWEQEFPQLSPVKRRGRRYYQRKDVDIVRGIKHLLHSEGFTISGAKQQLLGGGLETMVVASKPTTFKETELPPQKQLSLDSPVLKVDMGLQPKHSNKSLLLSELEDILGFLKS
ncbi:MAG: MerR family transcriptional regulator [Pseudomonadota bacterium]|nr:MerR family transcriptional regulator [Gammaproteobacteria bacterium]MBU1559110.1 MerR family transcriptional regulator [Gammaproteobacteria bacterium]MBU1927049.1 MerR family transcriptional regulator [Gammaproteobacteria bacterium]MBU2545862.1 MerR family transcriptional regulator [Gammaproteobacteria bacterium]